MALQASRRDDSDRCSYYVWFLGTEEARGLRGREYVSPVVAELVRKERHVEPSKVTLQLSGKGMKIVQHVARPGSGRAGQVKHFVPDHAITCAIREPPPDDDVVSCILLVFNPVTKCPVHVHTYRCDSPETAEMLETQLNTLAARPDNRARIQQIEARLVERGLVAPPGGSVKSRATYGSLTQELKSRVQRGTSAAGRGGEAGGKAGYQEDSSGIGSDDTPSPDHRERTSSDEDWTGAGNSSEDLLQETSAPRWKQSRTGPHGETRGPPERHSPDTEGQTQTTSGLSSTRRPASQRQRSPPMTRLERFDRSRQRFAQLERETTPTPPPLPNRPPPDVPSPEVKDVRGRVDSGRPWRQSRVEGSRGVPTSAAAAAPRGSTQDLSPSGDRARWRAADLRSRGDETTRAVSRPRGTFRTPEDHPRGTSRTPEDFSPPPRAHDGPLAPPGAGTEPRADEVLSRIDRWVLNSVAVAEAVPPIGVRRRHSGRQHADTRGHSPTEEECGTAGRLVKSKSTDTFLEHDVSSREQELWRRPAHPHIAEEMRRQSIAVRDEPVQRSRSAAHVAEDLRRQSIAAREETLQRSRTAPHVPDDYRRQSIAARDDNVPRSRSSAHVSDDPRRHSVAVRDDGVQRSRSAALVSDDKRRQSLAVREDEEDEIRRSRSAAQVADELRRRFTGGGGGGGRESLTSRARPGGMQRCNSSTSLLTDQRGRYQDPTLWRRPAERELGGRRGDRDSGRREEAPTGRRWGTLDREPREPRESRESRESRQKPRRRDLSYDDSLRDPQYEAREVRAQEGRHRGQRAGSRTPEEAWMGSAHDLRSRSRYSVADPRAMTRYDYRPSVTAQPY